MSRDFTDFLEDILVYSKRAREVVASTQMSALTEQSVESLALIRCMEVIGEAVKKIPQDVRANHPEVKWREAAGIRDILIHQYWAANVAILVDAVEKDLPDIERVVKQILADQNTAN